ncbi:hypothetical protein BJX76DRAFT_360636 [Aspergillus varians]
MASRNNANQSSGGQPQHGSKQPTGRQLDASTTAMARRRPANPKPASTTGSSKGEKTNSSATNPDRKK